MRIVVFGASGRTGRKVIEQALARGHEVTAFVRDASRLGVSHERLDVVEGDARDPEAVASAVRSRDAVISVLALRKAEDEPEYSDATRAIAEAAKREGVRRVVITANNNVFDDDEVTGEFAAHARDHRRNRDALRTSGVDWTIVVAPWVVDDPGLGSYQVMLDAKGPGRKITTHDLATAVVDAIEHDDWIGHIVGVTSAA